VKDRAHRIERELAALTEDAARRGFGARTWAGAIELPLQLEPDVEGRWRLSGEGLLAALEHALREAAVLSSPFQPGRVFCHRCETAGCGHAVPAAPTEVFGGYGPTGLPGWDDLGQVLLRDRSPDVDALYDDRPRLVAHVQSGERLKERLLSAFGRSSKTYDVLGQVVTGYFRARGRAAGLADDRLALSLQAVEHRGPHGELRLDLNVVGLTPSGEPAHAILAEALDERVTGPVRGAREALGALRDRLRADPSRANGTVHAALLEAVPGILRKLARDLASGERRKERRTSHAEHRRRQSRPVPAALRDARRARPEQTLVDEHEGTVVVLGRRNRVHVFSPDGRLVTSLSLEPDAVGRRLRRERWRRASSDERTAFRKGLDEVARQA
jgi:hypothetical protein